MREIRERERGLRLAKVAIGVAALLCLLTGLALYLFAERLGLDPDTAELVAIAFLVAGAADYLLLRFWDRIVGAGHG